MKTKWGIIGTGKIANRFEEDLLLVGNSQLYAIASRSEEKAKILLNSMMQKSILVTCRILKK